jgi:hypothetical protein
MWRGNDIAFNVIKFLITSLSMSDMYLHVYIQSFAVIFLYHDGNQTWSTVSGDLWEGAAEVKNLKKKTKIFKTNSKSFADKNIFLWFFFFRFLAPFFEPVEFFLGDAAPPHQPPLGPLWSLRGHLKHCVWYKV